MNEAPPVVAIEGLRKVFAAPDGTPFAAIDDISLTVRPGVLTALVGPDGAGKTTLIRMIAGLLQPDGGSLRVLGHDVHRDPQAVQNRISYMPQRFGLYDDLSVQENLDLYADLHGVPDDERRERIGRMLAMTDMARFVARPAGKLSGGMKQKLGLACTLVRSPDLLLLDEPSVGVDPLSRRELWAILEQLIERDRLSVLVSTAYMDEAARCDALYVLHHGRLLAQGTPDDLRALAQGLTYEATPPPGVPARAVQARLIDAPSRIVDAVPRGGSVSLIRRPECSEAAMAALVPDAAITPREAGLEDAFMLLLHAQPGADVAPAASPAPPLVRDAEPVIVVRDLVRRFGDFTAVANTSFDVRRGEIFGLLGPNGAGKTTTFRMLCGLLPATSGTLQVAGVNLRHARSKARARIGYVAQKFALYGNLTVRENLRFFAGAYGLRGAAADARIAAVIKRFGLDPAMTSGILPTGYKQRLAMAAGLLHQPDILFLDEPTSGIDPLARRAFWRTITELAAEGVTIIVTTHFMEEAEYCDRIAIQDAGRVLALGTPQAVREAAGGDHTMDMNRAFIAIVEQSRANGESAAA
ncbi:ATP-binding cassette domain-containing protein [Novosphingobium sp. Fuku2-ISO-50]|uniref:ATP-binding cassette domain-containing protein n=1 Tax=Novosphingobium sp. Fuku2-ISO-50 TaxID=1739114 RepID=UPI00076D7585|nr:ATP-binding cassette domain-containing protein [Novosphingobium sp. Fuku2-ISO-50]KUR75814.1 ABC transporter ATP-binding protein [Novosphingobium sp. Fuku2-ISO-50]